MKLEFHDTEVGNTLSGRYNDIDYDYQAEQIIQDRAFNEDVCANGIVKFVLVDDEGERAVWEKELNGNKVTLTQRSSRFTGQWAIGVDFESKFSTHELQR